MFFSEFLLDLNLLVLAEAQNLSTQLVMVLVTEIAMVSVTQLVLILVTQLVPVLVTQILILFLMQLLTEMVSENDPVDV